MKLGLVFAVPVTLAGAAGCSPALPDLSAQALVRAARPPAPQAPVYRLDFTINATDGSGGTTVVSDRQYTMVLQRGEEGSLHTGSNVSLGANEPSPRIDTGTTVRCKYDLDGDNLVVHAVLELSNATSAAPSTQTQVHKIQVVGDALVAAGKPALVATIADPTTHSRYQLNVAATRLY